MLFLFLSIGFLAPHKFYVSLTDMRFNAETNHIEISSKIFADDLEQTLGLEADQKFKMPMDEGLFPKVNDYFNEHFEVKADGATCTFELIGYELEEDVIWVYLESTSIPPPSEMEIRSTVLLAHFPEQQNIIHFDNGQAVQSLFLGESTPNGTILLD